MDAEGISKILARWCAYVIHGPSLGKPCQCPNRICWRKAIKRENAPMKRILNDTDSVTKAALGLYEKKEFGNAFKLVDDALRLDSKPDYHWLRGMIHETRGNMSDSLSEKRDNYKNSLADYRRCAELDSAVFLDKRVFPHIARFLKHDWELNHHQMTQAIHPIPYWPATTWAVPAYIHFLEHPIATIRGGASIVLGKLGSGANEALKALENASSKESDSRVAKIMNRAIDGLKISDRELDKLKLVSDIKDDVTSRLSEHEYITSGASIEYTDGDLDSEISLPDEDLMQRVTSPDLKIRARAICILGARKAETADACTVIAPNLADKDAIIRCLSVYAIGRFASNKATILSVMNLLPKMLQLLRNDKSYHVRKSAAEALGEIGIGYADALQGLIQMLENRDAKYRKVQATVIESLGKFGDSAKIALPLILGFKSVRDDNIEWLIKYEAILRIAPNDSELVSEFLPKIIGGLQKRDFDESVRLRAVKALRNITPDKMKRVLALTRSMWMDESCEVRRLAADSLLRVDHELAVEAGVDWRSKRAFDVATAPQ